MNSGLFKALSLLGLTWLSLMTKFIQTELHEKMSFKTKPKPTHARHEPRPVDKEETFRSFVFMQQSFESEKAHSHYCYYYNYTFLVSKEVTKNSVAFNPIYKNGMKLCFANAKHHDSIWKRFKEKKKTKYTRERVNIHR